CVGTGCTGGGGGDPNATNYNINAFAGNGNFGTSGDSGAATTATLKEPRGVALDAAGNVYIADQEAHAIRRVNAQGNISLFAGAGVKGFAGDNGPAANARFNSPTGLAVDLTRNILFVADTGNHRIRRIDLATNTITTLAGNGAAGLGGDGPAANAQLNYPSAVAVDGAGVVYVADTGNNRVVKISNSKLAAVAGNGQVGNSGDGAAPLQAKLDHPTGLAVTSDGTTIFVADRGNNRVRKITSAAITNFAGNGNAATSGDGAQATAAGLNAPTDVAVDGAGNVFITETDGERIRRVNTSNVISTIAGNGAAGNTGDDGPAISATLNTPTGLVRNNSTGVIFFSLLINPNNNNAGVYTVRVQAADSKGGTAQTPEFTITITDPNNNPPVAVMNTLAATLFAPSGAATATVNLNGTGSSDPDGDPITYAWFDGATQIAAGQMTTAQLAPGQHSIRLVVTDSKGATGSTTPQTVTVQAVTTGNRQPVAKIKNLPGEVFSANGTDAQVLLDGSDSSDPDGDPITYEWFDGNTKIATGVTAPVTLLLGQHSIKLVVTDDKTASNETAPQTVNVSATLPDIDITSVTPNSSFRWLCDLGKRLLDFAVAEKR
ncbi:MAG: SMP-30/gluconolactonase/LRE family protein, partial [Deltaproteobacteria bacterium]|nr:SMP-30/gluconolactonase/LRE family protein [Deltaproteobacteria bacterium]